MSYAGRLIHDLTLVVPQRDSDGLLDDYGHPEVGLPEETSISGNIQPKPVREILLINQAGAEIGDHVVFLKRMDIPPGAWIRDAAGSRYDITGVRRFDFGRTPHLEVDARKVTSEEQEGS